MVSKVSVEKLRISYIRYLYLNSITRKHCTKTLLRTSAQLLDKGDLLGHVFVYRELCVFNMAVSTTGNGKLPVSMNRLSTRKNPKRPRGTIYRDNPDTGLFRTIFSSLMIMFLIHIIYIVLLQIADVILKIISYDKHVFCI